LLLYLVSGVLVKGRSRTAALGHRRGRGDGAPPASMTVTQPSASTTGNSDVGFSATVSVENHSFRPLRKFVTGSDGKQYHVAENTGGGQSPGLAGSAAAAAAASLIAPFAEGRGKSSHGARNRVQGAGGQRPGSQQTRSSNRLPNLAPSPLASSKHQASRRQESSGWETTQ
jgi:hypothetical protein